MFRRRRFRDVIHRQLALFAQGDGDLLEDVDNALERYDRADRDEAEERFGDYQDLVETGTELLAELRDNFASTLGDAAAEQYEAEFNRAVGRRLPRFSLEL